VRSVEPDDVVRIDPVVSVCVKLNRRTEDVVEIFEDNDLTRVVNVEDEDDVVHWVRVVDCVVVFFTDEEAV
jgi:hypothetical protein